MNTIEQILNSYIKTTYNVYNTNIGSYIVEYNDKNYTTNKEIKRILDIHIGRNYNVYNTNISSYIIEYRGNIKVDRYEQYNMKYFIENLENTVLWSLL